MKNILACAAFIWLFLPLCAPLLLRAASAPPPPLNRRAKGFTLVELIVVITILAILGTIGFISFDKYSASSRDAVRTEDLSNIRKGLEAYEAGHGKYPMPDNAITIMSNGNPVRYQGYAGKTVLGNIKFASNAGVDLLDGTYYTYTVNANQTKMELLGYAEDSGNVSLNSLNPL